MDEEHAYVQYSMTMSEEAYGVLTGRDSRLSDVDIGKNKILVQALDTSGSMAGSPMEALKLGALEIGKQVYEAE